MVCWCRFSYNWFLLGHFFPTRSLYSAIQYIKFWPSDLGGNDRLNLDNVATMKRGVPSNEDTITMFLNVVPTEELSKKVEGEFENRDVQFFQHNDSQKYIFNNQDKKSHKISINGRTFLVTLNKIKKIPLVDVSMALEYEFAISELSLIDQIKNWF